MNEYVYIKSLALLKELSKANCLGLLIGINKDVDSEEGFPEFKFVAKSDVLDVIDKWISENGADDRSLDEDNWKYYNNDTQETIATRNYIVASKIIEAGYGSCLINIVKDTVNRKKLFIFSKNDAIAEIKAKQDAINRDIWLSKQSENKVKEE